jgi:hypothetical protein
VNTLNGPVNRAIISIAINQSGHIFVGVNGPTYRSIDNGNNWEQISPPTQASISIGLNGYLYAGMYHLTDNMAGGFVLRSSNNGTNWTPLPIQLAGCRYYVQVNPYNGYVFAGGTCGLFVYYSSNDGDNWNMIESGLTGNDVITFGFANNGYVYSGQENGKIYRAYIAPIGIVPISNEIPESFSLSQNYPNPFNPTTHFEFRIAELGWVRLTIYSSTGQEIETVLNRELSPGTYGVDFDGSDLPSGVYYYQLTISNDQLSMLYSETKKMVLVK